MTRTLLLSLIFAVLFVQPLLLHEGRIAAQDASPTTAVQPVNTPEGISADQVNVVAQTLWCPLCNGVRLDSCELKACAQMRDLIAIKLGEGESSESIQDYFVDLYGPQVLGRPPLSGFNWLAWLLPPLVLLVGGLLVWARVRTMLRPRAETRVNVPHTEEALALDDTYAQRLDAELKNHE